MRNPFQGEKSHQKNNRRIGSGRKRVDQRNLVEGVIEDPYSKPLGDLKNKQHRGQIVALLRARQRSFDPISEIKYKYLPLPPQTLTLALPAILLV
ncbi:hypothetical protein Zmor_004436 [Zophobas morio]|uniref:Uncharacterized protein n=1 Tax=Zophobas morio TaxID=2755281 RepID=A0AA38M0K9_9CUCU|nr:hypothetical protein Zmor_004436 [Zophobas morio]